MVTKEDTKAIVCRSPSGMWSPNSSPTCCAKPKYLLTCSSCVTHRRQAAQQKPTPQKQVKQLRQRSKS